MREFKQETSSKVQPQLFQSIGSLDTQEVLTPNNSLVRGVTQMSNPTSISGHAAMLDYSKISSNRLALLQLQRQFGNRYVQRVVQLAQQIQRQETRQEERIEMKPDIQRQPPEEIQTPVLPEVPNYQLPYPSLLQPPELSSRYRLGQDFQLHLDPQIHLMALQYVQQRIVPATIRSALFQVNPNQSVLPVLNTFPLGSFGLGATPIPNPFALPTLPPAPPLVPRGEGPERPEPASLTHLFRAILAVPAIDTAITALQTQAMERLRRDWGQLNTGERVGVVSSLAVIGTGALAGVLSDPNARQFALSQLNGRVLPVPGLNWLHLEMNTSGNNLMLGMHLDIGRLLPSRLGFGPSSPTAIGGPPEPQSFVPGQ